MPDSPDPPQDLQSFPPPWNYLIPLGRRALIWGIFFSLLWLLRRFLPLVFLTFVFAYIAEHGVEGLAHRIGSRRARTAIVFLLMIGAMTIVIAFLGPELKSQAVTFVDNLDAHKAAVNEFLDERREAGEFWDDLLKDVTADDVLGEVLGRSTGGGVEQFHETAEFLLGIFRNAASATTTFLLSLLFAFLIVGDLPRILRGIRSLKETRLAPFYDEVNKTIFRFAEVLGRFLEAQGIIATINTALTTLGMLILGIPQIAFLAGVVFICSFIPVAGVFISTFPICLVALDRGGFQLVVWIIVMVAIVHALEAYVLNPLIFGAHLHMNPVLVLAVLLIGHELFGIWGLLLGVPTVTYVFGYAIRHEPPRVGLLNKRQKEAS